MSAGGLMKLLKGEGHLPDHGFRDSAKRVGSLTGKSAQT